MFDIRAAYLPWLTRRRLLLLTGLLIVACNRAQQTGTLELKAAAATLNADSSTVQLTLAAKTSSDAPGNGTCHLVVDHGSFNGAGASIEVPIVNGSATLTYACDVGSDVACAGGHTVHATWNGANASTTVCAKMTCPLLGKDCDPVSDRCGATLDCGACSYPEICGIAGDAGVCATPEFDRVCSPEGVCWEHPLPSLHNAVAVGGTGPSDVWAGLSGGLMMHWNGVKWSTVKTPVYALIRAMQFSSPDDGLAITYDSTIIGWDGNSWTVRVPPNPDAGLNAAWFAPDGGIWAVGCGYDGTTDCASEDCPFNQPPRLMHWDGGTWTDYPMPFNGERELDFLWGLSADDLYATGSLCVPSILHWDGHTWTELPSTKNTPIDVGSPWAISPTSVWGASGSAIEHWDGAQWSVALDHKNYTAVWGASDLDVWAFEGSSDDDLTVKFPTNHVEYWDGGSWAVVDTGQRNLPRLMWGTAAEGWAFGDQGSIARLSPGRFTPISYATNSNGALDAVCTFGGGDVVAVGESSGEYMASGSPEVLRRASNGVWKALDPAVWENPSGANPLNLHGVICLPPDTIVAVGEAGTILTSSSGQWTYDNTSANHGMRFKDVWGTSFDDLWAVGASEGDAPQAYHRDGSGWHTVAIPASDYAAVHGSGPNDVWAVGFGGKMAHYDGSSWAVVSSPAAWNLTDVYALSPTDAWVVGEHETVMHWDGTSWQLVTTAAAPGDGFLTVVASSPTDVWIAGIAVMHWDGVSWSIIDRQIASWYYTNSTVDVDGHIWIVGWGDAVLAVP